MPYDPTSPLEVQVQTSVASSLKNLRAEEESEESSYLDCVLLHTPLPTVEETLQAWKILESYVPTRIRALGISNVTLPILEMLYERATIKPSVVQNRFYAQTRFDVTLRAFCSGHNITYQSFWTLTGTPALPKSEPVTALAKAAEVDTSIALYALVMELGVEVLNGTTSSTHMRQDLEGIKKMREWTATHPQFWASISESFMTMIERGTL